MKSILLKIKGQHRAVNEKEKRTEKLGNSKASFNHFNFKSLKTKLVAIFVILIIVPVLSVAYLSVSTSSASLISKAKENLSDATIQTVSYYEITLNQIERGYVNQISYDQAVTNFFKADSYSGPGEQFTTSAYARKVLQNVGATYSNVINGCVLVKNNDETIGYPVSLYQDMQLSKTHWYKEIADSENGIWMNEHNEGLPDVYDKNYVISFGKPIRDYIKNRVVGALVLDIKGDAFQNILSSVHVGKDSHSYAISNNHQVITEESNKSPKDELSFDSNILLQKVVDYAKNKDSMVFNQNYKGINYIVSFTKSKRTGWIFVTTLPEDEVTAVTKGIQDKVAVLGAFFIAFAVLIGILFSISITRAIQKLMEMMEKAEKGDLSVNLQLKRTDEIGKLAAGFGTMIYQIKNLVTQSKEAAMQVETASNHVMTISRESAKASSEIARAIGEVATGSSNQALEVENSVRNVTQLAAKINHAVESTSLMGSASDDVKHLTSDGIETVDLLNKKAVETNQITEKVVNEMGELNQDVKNIDKITVILKTIADQTNLLALNAAIEAARAGESGKGFAVVADEVRKLAEQSNNFTKEIQSLVTKILKQAESSADLVRKADITIKEQSNIVGETAQVFSNINKATDVLTTNIRKMSEIMNDIDKYKEQVMVSIESISAVSEQTAASAEEVSASTQEQLASIDELDNMAQNLNVLAQNLVSAMAKFKV